MWGVNFFVKCFSSIARFKETDIQTIYYVFVFGVGVDSGVVKGTLSQFTFVVGEFPRLASVIGTENPTFIGLYNGPNPVRICRGNGYPNFTDRAFGHPWIFGEVCPSFSTICGLPKFTIWTTAPHFPCFTVHLPCAGVQYIGIISVNDQICSACFITDIEYFFPIFASVNGFKNATFLVFAVGVSQGGHVDNIFVRWVHSNSGNGLGFFQP